MKQVKGVAKGAIGLLPGGNLINAGVGLAGALFGGGKGQPQNSPRNNSTDALAALLQRGLGGQNVGGQIASGFQLPGYTGSFGAGITPEQIAALQGGMGAFNQFMSGDRGASAIDALTRIAGGQPYAPPGMEALFANLPGSDALAGIASGENDIMKQIMSLTGGSPTDITAIQKLFGFQGPTAPTGLETLGQNMSAGEAGLLGDGFNIDIGSDLDVLRSLIGGGNDYISQVAGAGAIDTPERALLLAAANQDPTMGGMGMLGGAQDIIGSLMSSPALNALTSTGGFNPADIFSALDTQRRAGLARDERDIREQLGTSGLRFSTNLADIFSTKRGESEANMMGELARLMPQYAQTQQTGMRSGIDALLQAAGVMGNLGQSAGQLGLGRQSNVLSGVGQAGQLGLGAGRTGLDALIAAMQGRGQEQGMQVNAAQAAAGTNFNAQNAVVQALLQRLTGAGQLANARTGMQGDALSSLGNLNLGSSGQLLEALRAAGALEGDAASRALTSGTQNAGILAQLLGQQAGAAQTMGSQALQGQDILSRLFASQQSNALGAAQALPSAISSLSSLPMSLASSLFGMGEQARSIEDMIAQRQYQDFLNQRSMLPNIFSFLGGTPSAPIGPSGFQRGISGATNALTLLETLREMGG